MRVEFGNPEASKYWRRVVSSIPAKAMCDDRLRHTFNSRQVWAAGDAPERGIMAPISCAPNTVVCSGERDRGWYRISNVFGHTTAEWPIDRKPPIDTVSAVEKPISTTCNCWDFADRVGRYGAWRKGYLAHQAYEDAAKLAS
jgi:hypothetical protein